MHIIFARSAVCICIYGILIIANLPPKVSTQQLVPEQPFCPSHPLPKSPIWQQEPLPQKLQMPCLLPHSFPQFCLRFSAAVSKSDLKENQEKIDECRQKTLSRIGGHQRRKKKEKESHLQELWVVREGPI